MDVSIDFETYCEADLTRVGLDPYVSHGTFEVLMTAVSIDGGTVLWWKGVPVDLLTSLSRSESVRWHAFNAPFEQGVLRSQGIEVPDHRWRCTMAHAYARGFSGTMAQVGAAIGLGDEEAKLEGGKLIARFCKPAPRTHTVERYTAENDPEQWAKFREYNIRDVVTEMAIARYLNQWPWTGEEQADWEMDRRINRRGIPVDVGYVLGAMDLAEEWKGVYSEMVQRNTGGITASQTNRLLVWAKDHGYPYDNLQAETIRRYCADDDGKVAEVLDLRRSWSQAATAKYEKIWLTEMDGRIQETLVFRGAGRTGRWAGKSLQPQNLRRPPKGIDPDDVAESVADGTFDDKYGGPRAVDVLGGCVRAAIRASEGNTLVVADLNAIESRVLGWLANDRKLLQVFFDGRDPYKDFAAAWFHVPYESVTKEQRTLAKPAVLGGGYGLGGKGLKAYAESMGVKMTEETAQESIDAFRRTYGRIPALWYWIEDAFWAARAGLPTEGMRLGFDKVGEMTRIRLPSGRYLHYQRVAIGKEGLVYRGQNQYTTRWEEIRTYGAKLVENIVQAIACDVLTEGLRRCEEASLPVVFHLHDEIVAEAPAASGEDALQRLIASMTVTPSWAPGLPLKAAGYVALRHRKD